MSEIHKQTLSAETCKALGISPREQKRHNKTVRHPANAGRRIYRPGDPDYTPPPKPKPKLAIGKKTEKRTAGVKVRQPRPKLKAKRR